MSVLPSPAASATDVGTEDGAGSNAGTRVALGPPDATPAPVAPVPSRPARFPSSRRGAGVTICSVNSFLPDPPIVDVVIDGGLVTSP